MSSKSEQTVWNTPRFKVEFLYLDLNTCDRCQETETNLDSALKILLEVTNCLGYEIIVDKINVSSAELAIQHRFESSPTIRVNGQDILGPVKENTCSECSSLSGEETNCRIFEYGGKFFNEPPVQMILEAMLKYIFGEEKEKTGNPFIMPENLRQFYKGINPQKNSCGCGSGECC